MKKYIFLIILIIISLPVVFPLFHSGFFQTDDGEWMIIRFSAFHQAFRDGQFPVRFLTRLNHGYGYPVADFLYPGFMYLAEPIKIIGFGFVNTIKIVFGISMLGSALFSFLWLSKLFNKTAAFVGSVFYLYAPYHIFDLYKRGSIGEIVAFSIMPFIFWQLERKSFFWSCISIALLLLSHNTLAFMFVFLILLYMGLTIFITKGKERKHLFWKNIFIVLLSFGMSTFFWFPAVFDLQYTVFSKTAVSEWKNYFADYHLIGIATLLVFLATFFLFLTKKAKVSQHRLTVSFFVVGILSLFFTSQISEPLWHMLPASFIQFPFRFLSVTIFCSSLLAAFVVSGFSKYKQIVVGITLIVLTYITSISFMTSLQFFDKGEGFYATNEDTTTVKNEYMPKGVEKIPLFHPQQVIEAKNVNITDLKIKSNKITFTAFPNTHAKITANIVYFPGWFVVQNSWPLVNMLLPNEKGLISFSVPASADPKQSIHYEIEFRETGERIFANVVSIASMIILFFVGVRTTLAKKKL